MTTETPLGSLQLAYEQEFRKHWDMHDSRGEIVAAVYSPQHSPMFAGALARLSGTVVT